MSLQESLEKMKEELKQLEGEETEVEAEEQEEPEPEPEPEAQPEPEPEPVKPDAPVDDAGWAKLRRETAAAKKQAEAETVKRLELERKLEELRNGGEQAEEAATAQVDPMWAEMVQEYQVSRAEREFKQLESEFVAKGAAPDYDAVSREYAAALFQSIRVQNPRLSADEVAARTKKTILEKAGTYYKQHLDPAEELYHEAKSLGFTGASLKQTEAKPEAESKPAPKPDLKKVAENRKRSVGMAGNAGESRGQLTMEAASKLSMAEWAKLPAAERQRITRGG